MSNCLECEKRKWEEEKSKKEGGSFWWSAIAIVSIVGTAIYGFYDIGFTEGRKGFINDPKSIPGPATTRVPSPPSVSIPSPPSVSIPSPPSVSIPTPPGAARQ